MKSAKRSQTSLLSQYDVQKRVKGEEYNRSVTSSRYLPTNEKSSICQSTDKHYLLHDSIPQMHIIPDSKTLINKPSQMLIPPPSLQPSPELLPLLYPSLSPSYFNHQISLQTPLQAPLHMPLQTSLEIQNKQEPIKEIKDKKTQREDDTLEILRRERAQFLLLVDPCKLNAKHKLERDQLILQQQKAEFEEQKRKFEEEVAQFKQIKNKETKNSSNNYSNQTNQKMASSSLSPSPSPSLSTSQSRANCGRLNPSYTRTHRNYDNRYSQSFHSGNIRNDSYSSSTTNKNYYKPALSSSSSSSSSYSSIRRFPQHKYTSY